MGVKRGPALTGNLSRLRQGTRPAVQARVPIVKRTPTVTAKGTGNMTKTATNPNQAKAKGTPKHTN